MGIVSSLLGNLGGGVLQTSAMKGMNSGSPEGYGQSGIVGTILKMYLGGAIGGTMGGSAGGGASGMAGAANGISGVTSNLGNGTGIMDILGSGQNTVQQLQPQQQQPHPMPQSLDLQNMWQSMQQPTQQSGLMSQPGIPEYIRQMMAGNYG